MTLGDTQRGKNSARSGREEKRPRSAEVDQIGCAGGLGRGLVVCRGILGVVAVVFCFSHIFARFFDFAEVVIGLNVVLGGFGWLEIIVLLSQTLRTFCKMFLVSKKRERTRPGLYIFSFFSIYDDYYLHKYYRAHLPIDAKICNNK